MFLKSVLQTATVCGLPAYPLVVVHFLCSTQVNLLTHSFTPLFLLFHTYVHTVVLQGTL